MRKLLFTWLFIIGWTFAQLTIIDHVYNAEHAKDSVCEWCAGYGKKLDGLIHTAANEVRLTPHTQLPVYYLHLDAHRLQHATPLTRAPPQI
ncbi:hypothetical protein [Weissella cibaria]|jgi:hypothetical protein|uniref:hypothetical protein n=1 Tax=Weissella cibaria TaxID=137591 RepID=UPI00143F560C|nr:hypothetical protein [Weissella cibaria]NKO00832.1 hypothetical protein [Weissella cibaria]